MYLVDQVDLTAMQIAAAVIGDIDAVFTTAAKCYFKRLMPEVGDFLTSQVEGGLAEVLAKTSEAFKDKLKGVCNYIDDFGQIIVEIITSETPIPLMLYELQRRLKKDNLIDQSEPKFYESSLKSSFMNLLLALSPADIKTVKHYFKLIHPSHAVMEALVDQCCDINTETGKNLEVCQLWRRSKPHSSLMEVWCRDEKNQFKTKIRVPRKAVLLLNIRLRTALKDCRWIVEVVPKIGELVRGFKVRNVTSVGWTRILLLFSLSLKGNSFFTSLRREKCRI